MPRDATKYHTPDPGDGVRPPNLSEAQIIAAMALAVGASVSKAASAAGVDRTTVHRWCRDSAAFQATLNGLLNDRDDRMRQRVRRLRLSALTVIEASLTDATIPAAERAKLALAVIDKAGGVDTAGGNRVTDEAAIQRQIDQDEQMRRVMQRISFGP